MPLLNDAFYERQYSYKPTCTERELVDFLKSALYADFCYLVKVRKEAIASELMTAPTIEDVRRLQGESRGVVFWEEFPKALLASIMEEKEDAEPPSQST